jgi:hypothetical protein
VNEKRSRQEAGGARERERERERDCEIEYCKHILLVCLVQMIETIMPCYQVSITICPCFFFCFIHKR